VPEEADIQARFGSGYNGSERELEQRWNEARIEWCRETIGGKSEHVASCGGNMYIRERRGRVASGERWSEGHTGQVKGALSLQKSYSVI
jgi:hypothetical protein